jgi:hypothetical protein
MSWQWQLVHLCDSRSNIDEADFTRSSLHKSQDQQVIDNGIASEHESIGARDLTRCVLQTAQFGAKLSAAPAWQKVLTALSRFQSIRRIMIGSR